jgi:hypothetical protein
MSAGATAAWLAAGAAAVGTAASIDQANNAQHQARLRAEEQQRQLDEQARIQEETLAAQAAAQEQNMALAEEQMMQQQQLMDKQLKAGEESLNRANQKTPNTSRIVDQATQAGRAGASGTMLTGAAGVDPTTLQLGKSTLLGA